MFSAVIAYNELNLNSIQTSDYSALWCIQTKGNSAIVLNDLIAYNELYVNDIQTWG